MPAPRHIGSCLALAASVLPGLALADGISGLVEGDYIHSRSDTNEPGLPPQHVDSDQLAQRYRLILDRSLYPALRFNAGGAFEQIDSWSNAAPPINRQRSRTTNLFGNLFLTGPILSAAAGYQWRLQTSGAPGSEPLGLVFQDPSVSLGWRPEGLPWLTLRFERPEIHDRDRVTQDQVTNLFNATLGFQPSRKLDLRYSATYLNPIDRLRHGESVLITQIMQALWADRFSENVSASLNGTVNNRQFHIVSSGAAPVRTQVFPAAGLSLVESTSTSPTFDALAVNTLLNDTITTTGAGLNIGYGPTLSGDANFRDLGVQFNDAVTRVDTFYLWVDKRLVPAVSSSFAFAVYTSDNNSNWTLVPESPTVIFSDIYDRFEIALLTPIAARYLKVVTRPLNRVVTADQANQDIFVTELQTLISVTGTQGWTSSTQATASGTLRIVLGSGFAYDSSGIVSHSDGGFDTYSFTNGLSFGRRLGELVSFDARLARQDQKQSEGHQGFFIYSAALAVNELPTLGHSLVYSGQRGSEGAVSIDSISLYNRATPYRGIGLLAGGSLSYSGLRNGQTLRNDVLNFSLTVQPHAAVTLTSGYAHSASKPTEGPGVSSRNNRVEAAATFNPVPAFFLSGGVARIIADQQAFTLANASVSLSPFREGTLQISANAGESLDPGNHVTKVISATVRWNIHRGTVLSGTYSRAQLDDTSTLTSFDVNLRIPL